MVQVLSSLSFMPTVPLASSYPCGGGVGVSSGEGVTKNDGV